MLISMVTALVAAARMPATLMHTPRMPPTAVVVLRRRWNGVEYETQTRSNEHGL